MIAEGLVSLALGLVALTWPMVPRDVIQLVAGWGVMPDMLEIVAAAAIPRERVASWLLGTAGVTSLFLAILIQILPGADVARCDRGLCHPLWRRRHAGGTLVPSRVSDAPNRAGASAGGIIAGERSVRGSASPADDRLVVCGAWAGLRTPRSSRQPGRPGAPAPPRIRPASSP